MASTDGRPAVKRAVRENFDRSVDAYAAYEAETGRFARLARRLRRAIADRTERFDAILDAGAGTGASTAVFAERGAVVALDASRAMLAANAGARRVRGDIESLPFADDWFDVVAFTASLFMVPDPDRAVREARRVLRDGGVVGATVPVGWFSAGTDVFAPLARQSRSPQSPTAVQHALETAFAVEAGTWTFDTSPTAVRAFHAMPAGGARLYPTLPPADRRSKALALLDDLEGPIEQRWRWFVGR